MHATIRGLGEWVPDEVRSNAAWPSDFGRQHASAEDRVLTNVQAGSSTDLCDVLVARHLAAEAGDLFLGTTRRRVAPDAMTAAEAESRAALAALAEASIDPKDVDVLMSDAAVPDHVTPPVAPRAAHLIGATRAYAPGVNVGCASAIAQLDMAAALIESGRAEVVVLTQSFLITRLFPLVHPASPNIGDGATAMVITRSERPGIRTVHAVTHGEHYDSVLFRRRNEETRWHEAGGPMFLSTNNPARARKLIQDTVRLGAQTVHEMLDQAHLRTDEISLLVCVQPRRWIPGALAEVLGLQADQAPHTFDERAHLGTCGVVTNLIEARRRGLLREGMLVAMYAQGAGFTRAAGLLEWSAR